ncbi:phospholipase A2-like protein [Streptomyces sp. 1114.5]|uniref:phospholipase A2 n=1 Tax=Streptomyces sp. 1114.5 TaxID=1938830 RepID=UPI000EB569E4|nr:phospholipase A2 [Streptomyces sp. 1114.5]RKT09231.1 phospholipase A2-like protein [Streptomyces sp. 1114.5]
MTHPDPDFTTGTDGSLPRPGRGRAVRLLRMIALIVAAVLAISVSANAATRGKPARKDTATTVIMGKAVASSDGVYVLPKDGSGVYQWSADRDGWRKIGQPAKTIYAGVDTVYATNPASGDVWRYNGKPDDWTRISGPVADLAATDKHLYKIPADRSGVWQYTGKKDEWRKVGGPAAHLYTYTGKTKALKNAEKQRGGAQGLLTDSPLFATDRDSGTIAHYLGSPNEWSVIGQPGAEFAVTDESLFGLSPDRSGIWRWNGRDGKASEWTNVRNQRTEYIIAADTLFAVNPGTGDIVKHDGNGRWNWIGHPGTGFATSGGQLYGISPDGTGLYRYTWDSKNTWKLLGAPVAVPANRAEKIARLDSLTQLGPEATADWNRTLDAQHNVLPDRYEFRWTTNACNFPARNTVDGYDFTAACIRHDFGYRNYRDLHGEKEFRSNPNGKARIDEILLQDANNVCVEQGRQPTLRTPFDFTACKAAAQTFYYGVKVGEPIVETITNPANPADLLPNPKEVAKGILGWPGIRR